MKMKMTGQVIQASNYNMDGNKGGSVIVTNQPEEQVNNRAGLDIMKISAPFDIVDQLKAYIPCDCEMIVQPVQGAGGKAAFSLLSIKPVVQQAKAS